MAPAMGINNGILRGSDDIPMVRNLDPNLGCSQGNNPLESMIRFGKVDFPVFDGTDSVKGWLFQSEQFFEINEIGEGFKSQIAGMYMKGKALQWLQAYMKGKIKWSSWEEFCTAVCVRFGVAFKMKPMAKWRNIVQIGTVLEYQQEFEKVRARVSCSEEFAVEMFIGGLKEEIRHAVNCSDPKTLIEAYCIAQLHEANYEANFHSMMKQFEPLVGIPPFTQRNSALLSSVTPQPPRNKNIRTLSEKELEEKKAKGLCFWCDEKFVPGHRCHQKKLFNIEVASFEEEDVDTTERRGSLTGEMDRTRRKEASSSKALTLARSRYDLEEKEEMVDGEDTEEEEVEDYNSSDGDESSDDARIDANEDNDINSD
ncbi:hypothetical protein SLEP1_g43051 [Rubroshorea leprosula]|uniref:Ty3 transposon capsid-like protein domain-containing protein n=1 Tax=Rubroshorea leprosula TaxID=152421 RepID=A0AAV5LBS4_9ROSI|nr:hypothetical protein SLEP1_g43051 [Rubroshorea leprosula]